MLSKPVMFGLLAAACLVAAGGGAYVASLQNGRSAAVTAPAVTPTDARQGREGTEAIAGATVPVTETEAVVSDQTNPVPEPAPPATSERRAAPPRLERAAPRATPARPPRAQSPRVSAPSPSPAPAAPPTLERSWPSRRDAEPVESERTASVVESRAPVEPEPTVPEKVFEELVVSADSVIGLQVDTPLTSERAKVEDPVEARVTRDVKVGDSVAIPAGSRMLGTVTLVERGGKVKERARLGLRFHTVVLGDGTRVAVRTDTIYREGASPSGKSAAKIGGAAVGGAILGAILGGGKGAVLGGSVGAAGGTAAVMAGDRNAATLPAGTTVTVRVQEPVTVTVEK
jgi:hypothetical protein